MNTSGTDNRIAAAEAAPRPPGAASPDISVIVPTKNEAENAGELLKRLKRAMNGTSAEVIFVDDGDDEMPEVIARIRNGSLPVRLLRRPPEERGDGLGGAVARGIREARGEWFCVMDGDLQHPPEEVPGLLDASRRAGTDMVVASRYTGSGTAHGLRSLRLVSSRLCTLAAKALFPLRMRSLSDPLSGYFLVRRRAVDVDRLRPKGFKILMEILVRFPHLSVSEVPFHFQARHAGHSKAAFKEGLRYVRLLLDLRCQGAIERFTRFGLVGTSGLVVNQALLWALTEFVGVHYLLSAGLATVGSSLWNFSLIEAWVYRDRRGTGPRARRFAEFLSANSVGLLLRGPFLLILTSGLGVHYLASNLLSLLALAWVRYLLADGWIWSRRRTEENEMAKTDDLEPVSPERTPAVRSREGYSYDIHGIVRIASEVRLPELECFLTADGSERPDLRVRMPGRAERGERVPGSDGGSFSYREILGPLGFWVDVSLEETAEVVAGRLLKWSPHVLYTNVVEPVLRWMLVKKGYALVHSACIASPEGAILITARTDTGKTTTILRTLAQNGRSFKFLSDDMTIVGRTGPVFSYPKPLTISAHTLEAVNSSALGFGARLGLQVQSRVHSKSGRRTALAMARTWLPMATVNAIAQIIVPPPKYPVTRLIPQVDIVASAEPRRLVIIERGSGEGEVTLRQDQAMDVLMQNSEDAYGFPPYPKLAAHLRRWDGMDLPTLEREIITQALKDCPSTLMHSEQRNWWKRLPSLLNLQEKGDPWADVATGTGPVSAS